VDTGNYDDEDSENGGAADEKAPAASRAEQPVVKRGRGRPRKQSAPSSAAAATAAADLEQYDEIPLGRQGAKMMVAFGDGPLPLPGAVEKALLACRRCLHAAIRDARHVRRRHQRWYRDAQKHLRRGTASKSRSMTPSGLSSDSHRYQFRALQPGADALSKQARCGFALEELEMLFPEEMSAYQRWNEMHSAADRSTDGAEGEGDDDDNGRSAGSSSGKNNDESNASVTVVPGGHLQDRLEQFDIRTDRMDEDGYLQFSNVRHQGSFLPRRVRGEEERRRTSGLQQKQGSNDGGEAEQPRGRPADAGTAHMTSVMVRFLHWVGFDVEGTVRDAAADGDEGESPSGPALRLPAPSSETTHALAFLAHDFFGRIVEKAVFWRNVRSDETRVVLELGPGEQLRESDIQRALEDPEIRLEPMYAAAPSSSKPPPPSKPQLYFGPGFEDRLEMELEEMVEALTEEEMKEREEEERYFAQLAAAPSKHAIDAASSGPQSNADGADSELGHDSKGTEGSGGEDDAVAQKESAGSGRRRTRHSPQAGAAASRKKRKSEIQ
jgi:hypothetical protein